MNDLNTHSRYQSAIQGSTLGQNLIMRYAILSPALITGLVVAGLFLLIVIGYFSQLVEKNKLEKARLRADLSDRIRRCAGLSRSFPGQLMTPELKLLLARLELYLCERLQPLDRASPTLPARINELRSAVEKGSDIPVENLPVQILSEASAKEARLQLEDLQALVVWPNKQGRLDTEAAKHWLSNIQHMLVMLHIDYFNNQGRAALQQNSPHKARLAFERGVQYLRRHKEQARYQPQLKQLEANYKHANQLEQTQQKPALEEPNELAEGLKNLGDDDDWKITNIY